MRVLWLGDVVLPEFCPEFNIRNTVIAGWMSGALNQLLNYPEIEMGLCFPVFDKNRLRDGEKMGCKYYSFHTELSHVNVYEGIVERFKDILLSFQPDVIHIWGTEYLHSLEMFYACEAMGWIDRVIVSIQGLVSVYAKQYLLSVETTAAEKKIEGYLSLLEGKELFERRGIYEQELLKKVRYIAGRTTWDKACVLQLNKKSEYFYCPEIMRSVFYRPPRVWNVDQCDRQTIFFSQAIYPVKGLHILLQAVSIIINDLPGMMIRIAGKDVTMSDANGHTSPYGIMLRDLISQYSLEHNVVFLGQRSEEEMAEEYLKANVFVSSSTIENSSNSICEAMMIGTPLIASYVGGTPDLVVHSEEGFLFDINEPNMLAWYIQLLFKRDDICMSFSQKGREKALERSDPEKVVKIMMQMYERITGSNA